MPIPLTRQSDRSIPDWLVAPTISAEDARNAVGATEFDPVSARQKIEECARTGKAFHVSKSLAKEQLQDLKEYAQVVGLQEDQVVSVSDDDVQKANLAPLSKEKPEEKSVPEKDPFGLMDQWASEDVFRPNRDWETNKPAEKLGGRGTSEGSVQRVDGVETYEAQRDVQVRPGEASISDPDAIGKMAKKDGPSSRDVIRQSNEERRDSITFKPKEWEAEVLSQMEDRGIIAKGGIRMTEAADPQPHSPVAPGQHSIFDDGNPVDKMPDRTEGEKIVDVNEERRASIQREKSDDRSWDEVKTPTKAEISDLFYEQLKEQMG